MSLKQANDGATMTGLAAVEASQTVSTTEEVDWERSELAPEVVYCRQRGTHAVLGYLLGDDEKIDAYVERPTGDVEHPFESECLTKEEPMTYIRAKAILEQQVGLDQAS